MLDSAAIRLFAPFARLVCRLGLISPDFGLHFFEWVMLVLRCYPLRVATRLITAGDGYAPPE